MATTFAITYPVPQQDYSSDKVVGVKVTASQTFPANCFVKLTSGALVIAASADTTIWGFALAPAVDPVTGVLTGASGSSTYGGCPVLRVTPGMRFEMTFTGGAVAQANIGLQYGLLVTSGMCTVDSTNTTQKVFEVVEIPQTPTILDGGIGDTNGRVIVEVIASTIA